MMLAQAMQSSDRYKKPSKRAGAMGTDIGRERESARPLLSLLVKNPLLELTNHSGPNTGRSPAVRQCGDKLTHSRVRVACVCERLPSSCSRQRDRCPRFHGNQLNHPQTHLSWMGRGLWRSNGCSGFQSSFFVHSKISLD